jgi:hypothetical protein
MTVAQAIMRPTAGVVILAEISCGIHFRAWVVDGTYTNTYKVTTDRPITSVKWNLTTALTIRASAALVDANAGSFYWDGATLWVRPVSGSIFDATVQGFTTFYFANRLKILSNVVYEPRLISAPNLSQRIEAVFGGVGQIGGGNISLANADGYFDAMQDYQWDAGAVTLKVGIDLPGNAMAIGDYETLATWIPEDWSRDAERFELKVIESKARLKSKLPFEFYTRDDYSNIDDEETGKPIPIAYGHRYGIKPTLIDPGAKQFKIAGHVIKELSAVRLQRDREEFNTETVTDWYLYSGDVYRFYISDVEVTTVKFDGATLLAKDSLEDVEATDGTWIQQENYLYVHPSAGETMTSGTYTIEHKKSVTEWADSNFASVDLANGEFTLGDDYTIGQSVSVDLRGKTDVTNAIDIIEDILTLVGETNLDAASFTAASGLLETGIDDNGNPVVIRQVGIYLQDPDEVLTIIGDILAAINGYMFSDASGQYHVGIFEPTPGESLPRYTDADLLDFEELTENQSNISTVQATFQPRVEDDYQQHEVTEETALQYIHSQPSPVVKEVESILTNEDDVENFNQRALRLEGNPLKRFSIKTAWRGLQLQPGSQIWLQSTARGVDEVLEILEVKLDLGAKTTSLILGNLRGIGRESGFWVADADVLPTRFSALDGYAAGVLAWNAAWDDEIKLWAKQNVGHWTDANGFADTADEESHRTSTWV